MDSTNTMVQLHTKCSFLKKKLTQSNSEATLRRRPRSNDGDGEDMNDLAEEKNRLETFIVRTQDQIDTVATAINSTKMAAMAWIIARLHRNIRKTAAKVGKVPR